MFVEDYNGVKYFRHGGGTDGGGEAYFKKKEYALSKIDYQKVLELEPTNPNADMERLERLYTKKEILDHLKNTKELIGNEVGALVSKRYQTTPFVRFKKRGVL